MAMPPAVLRSLTRVLARYPMARNDGAEQDGRDDHGGEGAPAFERYIAAGDRKCARGRAVAEQRRKAEKWRD